MNFPFVPDGYIEALSSAQGIEYTQSDYIPPIFYEMEGQILDFNLTERTLVARFPVQPRYQNAYSTMQGGMIATAIDNAFGPLSLLIAPPNVTRHLEIKYKKSITLNYSYIFVKAKVKEVKIPYIYLSARVESETEELFALSKAVNYILPMNK